VSPGQAPTGTSGRLLGLGNRFAGRGRGALLAGLVMLGLLVAVALAAPLLAADSPNQANPADILAAPSGDHLFGTDQYGRDIFARTLHAARVDLLIGLLLVGVAVVIGTTIGLISGWLGGWVDAILMRIVDIGFAFPFLVLVICMVGLRGPGLGSLFFAVSLVAWIFYARLVRGEVLVSKQQNYVKAARTSGFSTSRILARHVLPNVGTQVLLYATSDFVYAVLLGASVSYLGLGVQPPTPEWGAMVQQGQNFVTSQWWISLFPGLAIVYLGIAMALIGDGLADLLRRGRT
jgi:peptide/nickel transport system permease protein